MFVPRYGHVDAGKVDRDGQGLSKKRPALGLVWELDVNVVVVVLKHDHEVAVNFSADPPRMVRRRSIVDPIAFHVSVTVESVCVAAEEIIRLQLKTRCLHWVDLPADELVIRRNVEHAQPEQFAYRFIETLECNGCVRQIRTIGESSTGGRAGWGAVGPVAVGRESGGGDNTAPIREGRAAYLTLP